MFKNRMKKKEIPGTCTSSLLHFDPKCQMEFPSFLNPYKNGKRIRTLYSYSTTNDCKIM